MEWAACAKLGALLSTAEMQSHYPPYMLIEYTGTYLAGTVTELPMCAPKLDWSNNFVSFVL